MNKMAKKGVFLLLAVFSLVLLMCEFANAEPINISYCPFAITNGSWIFTRTLDDIGGYCWGIIIFENNTEIDCNGYGLIGTGLTNTKAFVIGTGNELENITIKNCNLNLTNWTTGIYTTNVVHSSIINNTILATDCMVFFVSGMFWFYPPDMQPTINGINNTCIAFPSHNITDCRVINKGGNYFLNQNIVDTGVWKNDLDCSELKASNNQSGVMTSASGARQ